MNRRIVFAAVGVLVAAVAGCQTMNFSTPTSTPAYQTPSQLMTGGAGANPVASEAPKMAAPAASAAAPAAPASDTAAAGE